MESAFNEKVPGAEKNFHEIEERYKHIVKETFGISSKLSTPVANIKNNLSVQPMESLHTLTGGRVVTITSPVRWVLCYKGSYNLSDLLEQKIEGMTSPDDDVRRLVLRSLVMWKLIDSSPPLASLLDGLRFRTEFETAESTGALPIAVVNADVPAFRPQDALIEQVIELSGKVVFEELVDVDALSDVVDPFASAVQSLLA